MAEDDVDTYELLYEGPPVGRALAQMLHEDGIRVVAPESGLERRGLPPEAINYAVEMAAYGSGKVIDAVIAKFRARHPDTKVTVTKGGKHRK